eukprot:jgi/Psemu1/53755/gm1.53755_g
MGLLEDFNGIDVKQTADYIELSFGAPAATQQAVMTIQQQLHCLTHPTVLSNRLAYDRRSIDRTIPQQLLQAHCLCSDYNIRYIDRHIQRQLIHRSRHSTADPLIESTSVSITHYQHSNGRRQFAAAIDSIIVAILPCLSPIDSDLTDTDFLLLISPTTIPSMPTPTKPPAGHSAASPKKRLQATPSLSSLSARSPGSRYPKRAHLKKSSPPTPAPTRATPSPSSLRPRNSASLY